MNEEMLSMLISALRGQQAQPMPNGDKMSALAKSPMLGSPIYADDLPEDEFIGIPRQNNQTYNGPVKQLPFGVPANPRPFPRSTGAREIHMPQNRKFP